MASNQLRQIPDSVLAASAHRLLLTKENWDWDWDWERSEERSREQAKRGQRQRPGVPQVQAGAPVLIIFWLGF